MSTRKTVYEELSDSELRQDFVDSVTAVEMDFETVPAELIEAFGDSVFSVPEELISDDDMWGTDGLKQERKR